MKKAIPPQIINEGAAFTAIDFKQYLQFDDGSELQFFAELSTGESLPTGLICTSDGVMTGIPAKGTSGNFTIKVTGENNFGIIDTLEFPLVIKPSLMGEGTELLASLKSKVWEALGKNLPLPEMEAIVDRPITAIEIYYLLQRFATLTVWDVYNLDPPAERAVLQLEGTSPHYVVYDRGSCLIGAPKDLFSHDRNLEDALQTARAMAREVYRRGWTIEFAGFDKMLRAAWVEIQVLGDQHGKQLDILHFNPTSEDVNLYKTRLKNVSGPGVTRGGG